MKKKQLEVVIEKWKKIGSEHKESEEKLEKAPEE